MSTMTASQRVLFILNALIEEYAGLHYEVEERGAFADRVSARALEAGFESLLDYYYFLRYDPKGPAELKRLVDDLVIGETYFFRELEPLRVAVEHFIAPKIAKGRRPRIWSAACATGEEPATIAMLLAQQGLLDDVEIVASDISEKALDRARAGIFSRRSLREVPSPALVARWMREDGEGRPSVAPELHQAISFRRINIANPDEVASVGLCDVILCRNVLIYFRDEVATRVVDNLSKSLKPDGALFVGVSESLLRLGSGLECEEAEGVFYYRKSKGG